MTVDQIQARQRTRDLCSILDDLPLAHDQLWLHLLPAARAPGMGSRQQHSIFSQGNVLNLDALDLLSTAEKPDADVYRTAAEIELDRDQGRRQGVLPTLTQWVRLVDDALQPSMHEPPFALATCGPACRFKDHADEVALWPIYPGHACTEDEFTHWRKPTVVSHCRWLRSHSDYISEQDWGAAAEADLRQLLHEVQMVTGTVDRTRTMPCLSLTCGNLAHSEKGGALYRCEGCGQAWSRGQLMRTAERNAPRTLIECAALLSVSERTLRTLLAQQLIAPIPGMKRGKSPLFDPREVDAATMTTRYRATRGQAG